LAFGGCAYNDSRGSALPRSGRIGIEAYASSIMGNPTQRSEHIMDATDFFTGVASGTLPAVSFVKPDGLIDGSSAT